LQYELKLYSLYRGSIYNSWNICCGWIDHLQCWYTKSRLYETLQTE
jgi:hypothetical protein